MDELVPVRGESRVLSSDATETGDVVRELIDSLRPSSGGGPAPNVTVNIIKQDARSYKQKTTNTSTSTTNNAPTAALAHAESPLFDEDPSEHSKCGKCLYEPCKKEIFRNYSGEGEGSSYIICQRRCKKPLVIHDGCAERFSRDSVHEGVDVVRVCGNCKKALVFDPEGAWLRAAFDFFMDWPWWLLTRLLPALILLGFLSKLPWFALVAAELRPTDYLHNPKLVEFGLNDTVMLKAVYWGNGDIMQYNFCLTAYMQTDFLCNMMMLPSCKGYYECSWGLFDVLSYWPPKTWKLLGTNVLMPLPMWVPDSGNMWIGVQTGGFVYVCYWIWRSIRWCVIKITYRYRRPSVRITNKRLVNRRR